MNKKQKQFWINDFLFMLCLIVVFPAIFVIVTLNPELIFIVYLIGFGFSFWLFTLQIKFLLLGIKAFEKYLDIDKDKE